MKKLTLLLAILLISSIHVQAQKKKDLLDEIEKLRTEIKTTKQELTDSHKKEKVAETKVKSMEVQVADLKETNANLLKNMSSFTELSNKKASNLGKSQEIIQRKDIQLNAINGAITAKDSINLKVFSMFKNAVGGDNLKISNGVIYLTIPNNKLFGDDDKNYVVDEKAKPILGEIAKILNSNTSLNITVEGNSNALKLDGENLLDNWDLSSRQAASVVRVLQKSFKIDPKRMETLGKSEYSTKGVETITRIIIDPKFDQFYELVKDNMKNGSK